MKITSYGVTLGLLLTACGVAMGCSVSSEASQPAPPAPTAAVRDLGAFGGPDLGSWIVVTSPETGCEFIIVRDQGGSIAMTPNMARFHDLTTFHKGCRRNTMGDQE